jgi:hypothetical protein
MEFVMSRLLICITTASLLSITAQAVTAQDAHERPEAEPGALKAAQVEVEAGRLHSPYDLASSGLSSKDLVLVSNFASAERVIDGSSRGDY